MAANWLSALVAGVIAAMLWTSFSLWLGGGTNLPQVGMWAVILQVATTLVTFLISRSISASKHRAD